ncbi:MAG: NAD(+)/NADH kinase [Burkholderiales bacterium]|jgi:NAD+ kinase|nr:NAD(+)/NADH kinase [Burkholderiales bacterium]
MLNSETPFNRIALAGRRNSPELFGPLSVLADFLTRRGYQVSIEAETAAIAPLSGYPVITAEALGINHDLVVVLGGDGTMLSYARRLAPFDVPLVGINQGRLGFLTDIPQVYMEVLLGDILDGHFVEEKRSMLVANVLRESGGVTPSEVQALNDIVINRGSSGAVIDLSIAIDGQFAYSLRADGIIVATPTGSTAYALSAGGPIVAPMLPVFVLVPVAPHALTHRPIIIPETAELTIVVERGNDVSLHGDSQSQIPLMQGERVTIERSPHKATLLHPSRYDYFSMLRQKLHWTETPERLRVGLDEPLF